MSSNEGAERLDLARGLPTTPLDNEVLHALRYASMTDSDYARFLAGLTHSDPSSLATKRGPHGEAFRLPPAFRPTFD
jgi:hypothetical protein